MFITRIAQYAGDTTGNTATTSSKAKVYKSTNYAGSWTGLGTTGMLASGAQIRNVGVAPTNASVVGIVTSGGAYRSSRTAARAGRRSRTTNLANNGSSLSYISFDPTNTSLQVRRVRRARSKAISEVDERRHVDADRRCHGLSPTGVPRT